MSGIKIAIEISPNELHKLLGDTPEARIELSNSIIQAFSTKHLKGLVNSAQMQTAVNECKAELKTLVEKELVEQGWTKKKQGNWGQVIGMTLGPTLLSELKEAVKTEMIVVIGTELRNFAADTRATIEEVAQKKAGKSMPIAEQIEVEVGNQLTKAVNQLVEENVEAQLTKMGPEIERRVEERVQQRLLKALGIGASNVATDQVPATLPSD